MSNTSDRYTSEEFPQWIADAMQHRTADLAGVEVLPAGARPHVFVARAIAHEDNEFAAAVEYLMNQGATEPFAFRLLGLSNSARPIENPPSDQEKIAPSPRAAAEAALMAAAEGMASETNTPVAECLEAIWQNASDESDPTYPEDAVAEAAPEYAGKQAFMDLCREVLARIDPDDSTGNDFQRTSREYEAHLAEVRATPAPVAPVSVELTPEQLQALEELAGNAWDDVQENGVYSGYAGMFLPDIDPETDDSDDAVLGLQESLRVLWDALKAACAANGVKTALEVEQAKDAAAPDPYRVTTPGPWPCDGCGEMVTEGRIIGNRQLCDSCAAAADAAEAAPE